MLDALRTGQGTATMVYCEMPSDFGGSGHGRETNSNIRLNEVCHRFA
jgi:hypothetical protein